MQSERRCFRYFRYFRKNIVSCFGQCLHLYAAPKTQSHASDGEMITARYARLPRIKTTSLAGGLSTAYKAAVTSLALKGPLIKI